MSEYYDWPRYTVQTSRSDKNNLSDDASMMTAIGDCVCKKD